LIFIGALTDWVLSTFNADDFIGKVICNRIDVTNLVGGRVRVDPRGTLEGSNAKYDLGYTVVVEKV
jgi:hypothetical protein